LYFLYRHLLFALGTSPNFKSISICLCGLKPIAKSEPSIKTNRKYKQEKGAERPKIKIQFPVELWEFISR